MAKTKTTKKRIAMVARDPHAFGMPPGSLLSTENKGHLLIVVALTKLYELVNSDGTPRSSSSCKVEGMFINVFVEEGRLAVWLCGSTVFSRKNMKNVHTL